MQASGNFELSPEWRAQSTRAPGGVAGLPGCIGICRNLHGFTVPIALRIVMGGQLFFQILLRAGGGRVWFA